MSGNKKNLNDIDNFWDLDNLLPQKRPVSARREISTDTFEIELGKPDVIKDSGISIPPRSEVRPLESRTSAAAAALDSITSDSAESPDSVDSQTSRVTSAQDEARRIREVPLKVRAQQNEPKVLDPYLIYEPDSNIIKNVAVAKWQTRYNFYEKFAADARRLWNRTASACEPVSFFSYIPQYNQLSYTQLKWYLYWREQIRSGIYPRADYSYVLLYIYEILNCPDLIEPERGIELLCDIWLEYRTQHPRIDNYLCEWVCDYCLINQLPCPTQRLEPIMQSAVTAASFKEFYMDSSRKTEGAANILAYSSNYDWRTSRYITKENIGVFANHIQKAFDKIYREILSKSESGINVKPAKLTRDAYNGALCVYDMKRCLYIDYISYTRSPHFRFAVTDIIKYCENRIRMALGIKARLKVENLTNEMRFCLDDYFDTELPIVRTQKNKSKSSDSPEVNEYDKLYEPVSTKLSLENALDIEKKSWDTTEILTTSLIEESIPQKSTEEIQFQPLPAQEEADTEGFSVASDDEFDVFVSSLGETELKALRKLTENDTSGIASTAAESGILADALADKINEAAFDIIGDSIIEPCGGGYKIISDYEGDILKCLK